MELSNVTLEQEGDSHVRRAWLTLYVKQSYSFLSPLAPMFEYQFKHRITLSGFSKESEGKEAARYLAQNPIINYSHNLCAAKSLAKLAILSLWCRRRYWTSASVSIISCQW